MERKLVKVDKETKQKLIEEIKKEFHVGDASELRKNLTSKEWFLIGGNPQALEKFAELVKPNIKVYIYPGNEFKTTFWAKKTPLVASMFNNIDWDSRIILLELVLDVNGSILSEVTYVSNDEKMEENIEKLLGDFIPK